MDFAMSRSECSTELEVVSERSITSLHVEDSRHLAGSVEGRVGLWGPLQMGAWRK